MIPCICINAKGKPKEIVPGEWIQQGFKYHITHIYRHPLQGDILACTLHEVKLTKKSKPYETYRLNRFAFKPADMEKLKEMAEVCSELDELNIDKLFEVNELELITK